MEYATRDFGELLERMATGQPGGVRGLRRYLRAVAAQMEADRRLCHANAYNPVWYPEVLSASRPVSGHVRGDHPRLAASTACSVLLRSTATRIVMNGQMAAGSRPLAA